MGDFIDGEVFVDIPLRGSPHEGVFGGVKLEQEGAMTLGGCESRSVGN